MVDFSGMLNRLPSRESMTAALDRVPATRGAVSHFVTGETVSTAVAAVEVVRAQGMSASVAYLAAPDAAQAALPSYLSTIGALDDEGLAEGVDLLVSLADLGLARSIGSGTLREVLAAVCGAAGAAGMTVTLGSLDLEHVDEALAVRADLAGQFPDLGVTIAASLLRSEADCWDLATQGARVRLVRREVPLPSGVGFTSAHEIDKAYVRCTRLLLANGARTTVATDDTRLIEIATALAHRSDPEPSHDFQFRYGLLGNAADLVAAGEQVGVLVPYGPGWSTYIARNVPMRPGALGQAARTALGWNADS